MATNDGKISAMQPLDQITPDVWFECITRANNSWVNRKVSFNKLKGELQDLAESAYDIAVRNGFHGTEEQWLNSLKGRSAYQIAFDAGQFAGTEQEWVAALDALYRIEASDVGKVLMVQDGRGQWTTMSKATVGLDQVDNTADLDKPVSTATQAALDLKADKGAVSSEVVTSLESLGLIQDPNGDLVLDEGTLPT